MAGPSGFTQIQISPLMCRVTRIPGPCHDWDAAPVGQEAPSFVGSSIQRPAAAAAVVVVLGLAIFVLIIVINQSCYIIMFSIYSFMSLVSITIIIIGDCYCCYL